MGVLPALGSSEVITIPHGKKTCYALLHGSSEFLERIVTADKIWVNYYEPKSKAQIMVFKRPTSPMAKKFKSQPSAGKIWLTILEYGRCDFWFISLQRVKPFTVRFSYVWPNERSSKRNIFIP
jgi:hypothetical protein